MDNWVQGVGVAAGAAAEQARRNRVLPRLQEFSAGQTLCTSVSIIHQSCDGIEFLLCIVKFTRESHAACIACVQASARHDNLVAGILHQTTLHWAVTDCLLDL